MCSCLGECLNDAAAIPLGVVEENCRCHDPDPDPDPERSLAGFVVIRTTEAAALEVFIIPRSQWRWQASIDNSICKVTDDID